MKSVFASVLACLAFVLSPAVLAADSGGQGDEEKQLFEGDKAAGAKLSGTCVACHGADGNSTNPEWPKIAGQHASYTFAQLQAFKSGDRQNALMAGQVANLSEQDMRDLAVYYAGQKAKPGVADESLVEDGARIYRAGKADRGIPACSGCHGPAGTGNPTAVYPRVSGQHAPYLQAQLESYRSGERNNSRQAKIMSAVAAELTDDQIKALSSYMSGLYPRAAE